MKTMIIGDLHGKIEVVEKVAKALHDDENLNVIFIGDYVDAWDRSIEEQIETFRLVEKLVKDSDDERVVALCGNHEMSYLNPKMRSSGYSLGIQTSIFYPGANVSFLKSFVWRNGFLISHAGVSRLLLKDFEMESVEEYLSYGDFTQIGLSRGGMDVAGGLFWCDWNLDFAMGVEETKQIVGHTRVFNIEERNGNYCVDCLDTVENVLMLSDNGSVEIVAL